MKKLLVIFFLVAANYAFGQYPTPYQNLGSPTTAVRDTGGLIVRGMFMPPNFEDTIAANQSNYANKYSGSFIFTTSDSGYWARNAALTKWIRVGTGSGGSSNFGDTVFVRTPDLGVDTTTYPGHQIIFFRRANGLISGGVVTLSGCRTLTITPANYALQYMQYTSLLTTVSVDTSSPTLNRIDYVIADTNDIISVKKGTPAATPLPPYVNPSSELVITQINIPAAAGCLNGITATTVYDENLGVGGGEWDATTSGTLTNDYDNTDNPYHLTKAAFLSSYEDGSQQIFTHTGSIDTIKNGEVLSMWAYFNNVMDNQIQLQLWRNDTAVTQNTVINPYFNKNDSNNYQNIAVQFANLPVINGTTYNKIVFTLAGVDTSGAKGFYLDYIQLINGIINPSNQKVDSVTVIASNLYYWINGQQYLGGAVGGGSGGTVESVTGLNTDNTDPANPIVKLSLDAPLTGLGTPASHLAIDTTTNGTGLATIYRANRAYVNIELMADSTGLVYIRDNGERDTVLWTGGNNITYPLTTNKYYTGFGTFGSLPDTVRSYFSATSPIFYNSSTGVISSQAASGSQNGYLTSANWTTFNGKQDALTLTTTGSSGAATLVGATLNIPQYSGGSALTNDGSGYRWTKTGTSLKTLFAGNGISADSSSNTNGITLKADTSILATKNYVTNNISGGTVTTVTGSGNIASSGGTTPNITFTGTLPIANGGTNITGYTTGDIIYASATNVLSKLPIGTTRQKLGVVGGVPAWMDSTAVSGSSGWGLTGNASTVAGTNFLGTTDSIPFEIKANNVRAAFIGIDLTGGNGTSTSFGMRALSSAVTSGNVAFGWKALRFNNSSGNNNSALGSEALGANTSGINNTATGFQALLANTTGQNNTADGSNALKAVILTGNNTALGYNTLSATTAGADNTAAGSSAGANNTGSQSVAVGSQALINVTGSYNTAVGYGSLGGASGAGSANTGIGRATLFNNTSGTNNIAIGYSGGQYNSTASNQVFINSFDRGSYVADQNQSPVYIKQSSTDLMSQVGSFNGKLGINNIAPTAFLHLSRGTNIANTAPLKFNGSTISLATTATSGNGSNATITFATTTNPTFVVGTQIIVAGVTPSGYNGTYTVLNSTATTVTFLSATTGAQTVAGTITQANKLTTPEDGAVEYDGTDYYVTTGSTRYILTRTLVGTAAPATTPAAVGIHFVDTVNKKEYVATGTSSSADWTILN